LHRIRAAVETYDDNANDFLREAQAKNVLKINASNGCNIDGGNDIEDEGLGALGVLAVIFGIMLSISLT